MTPVRWWHCFWGHRWTQWKECQVAITFAGNPDKPIPATWQTRTCVTCGKEQTAKVIG